MKISLLQKTFNASLSVFVKSNSLFNSLKFSNFFTKNKHKSLISNNFLKSINIKNHSKIKMVETEKKGKENKNEKDKNKFAVWEGILKNAEMGKVVTRFPPEPSGYLHIGHIKAVILNRHFADIYQGKMLIRFDDTNPEKESSEFADCIIEDLNTVGIKHDDLSYSTDFFELCEKHMTKLIEEGKCYCDNTPVDKTREERDKGIPSQCRDVSPEENMKIWLQMIDKNIASDSPIKKYCVRGKIDYKNKNKCLRDPVFYRFCEKPHHRLGDSYKLFPMYDFSTAILDHKTGVTHMLRTNEYADRIPMYRWVEEALGLGTMNIFEYSRMNLVFTVLSKRKLKWLVENQKVDGWDDPRLPTLRGILRRGVRIESIKNLILEIGPTTNSNLMQWDKLYSINRDIIDPTAKRLFGVNSKSPVLVEIENFDNSMANTIVDWHPKNKEIGQRTQIRSNKLFMEPEDAKDLVDDMKLTLYKWGNSRVTKLDRNENGEITKVYLKVTPEDLDFKKTKVAHWVSANEGDVSFF